MGRINDRVTLEDTGVISGTYTSANIVVDRKGRIVSATDGIGGTGSGSATLDGLTDTVIITPIVNEQFLRWNGTAWTNETVSLNGIDGVNLSAPQSGEFLSFDGIQWSNFDIATIGVLVTSDIGVTVQAWDAGIDSIAAFDTLPGFAVQTAANTFTKRLITAGADGGISIVNGDGVAGNVDIAVDINNAISEAVLDGLDSILFFDASVGALRKTTVSNFVSSGGVVTDGVNLGTGADLFTITTSGIMNFRGIDSSNSGIVVSTNVDTVFVGVNPTLNSISQLPTTSGNIIVGNGTTWEAQNGSVARTSLGLGDIATRNAIEFLEIAGGVMAGSIDMGSNIITGLTLPIVNADAANKQYVDAQVSAGVIAGDGLTKTGSSIDVVNLDGTLTVSTNEIRLNQTSTDILYIPRTRLESSVGAAGEGASNIGTPQKPDLGNAVDVETALQFINDNFSIQKFQTDLTSIWNLDVGAPNVIALAVRDVEVARFNPGFDTAIYVDLMLPPTFNNTSTMTFYASWAKSSADVGTVEIELAFQHQRPGTNFPSRGPAPNWDWLVVAPTVVGDNLITTNDNLLHQLVWTIPASLQPLDTLSLRMSRMGAGVTDDFALEADFFAGFIIEN